MTRHHPAEGDRRHQVARAKPDLAAAQHLIESHG
jgi:hypothetical protein